VALNDVTVGLNNSLRFGGGAAEETPRGACMIAKSDLTQRSGRLGRPTPMEERQAMARLSFALSHVLRLFRLASIGSGGPTGDLVAIEDALGRAQLPEDYVDVAKAVAQLKAPPPGASNGIGASVHQQFANLFREIARALALPELEEEIRDLATVPVDRAIDPTALLEAGRRLVASVLVQQSTTEVLDECLKDVDGGIQRMAQQEDRVSARVIEVRHQLEQAPGSDAELLRRTVLSATIDLERLVEQRRAALLDLQRSSRMAQRRAERLLAALADATSAALTDPLTGLGNRRALQEAVARIAVTPNTTGIVALDLDHFKRVNDSYGHAGGDRVLVHVAELLRAELRGADGAFRVGGEELLVLLSNCDLKAARATAERIRVCIASSHVPIAPRKTIQVTTSIGVTLWGAGASFDCCHDLADEALYQAKSNGRNCVVAL
jgi:diguanylate cyclase (GGDEF)-like protein